MKYLHYSVFITLLLIGCAPQEKAAEPNIVGEEISYATDDVNMNGFIAYDASSNEKRPGILVVHEWWGHNEHARDRAEKLAELGYVALAVDMYGDGKLADHPEDAQKFMMSVMTDLDAATARFEKALETLKANPNVDTEHIGAIGFCFGGSVIISMANAGIEGLDAVAAFHSGVAVPFMPEKGKTKARILVQNGGADPMISAESISDVQKAMDEAEVDYTYISYEGVLHSFTNPAADSNGVKFQMPMAYDAKADSASWEEMKVFFEETFNSDTSD